MSFMCVCFKGVSNRAYVELPVHSKYLVIAAYIASYNPAKSDKQFFSKVCTGEPTKVGIEQYIEYTCTWSDYVWSGIVSSEGTTLSV